MGNRAVITTTAKEIGIYLHWNGGRDSVEGFLGACKQLHHRPPEKDCYGWARLCQVIANFFGGQTSIGIDLYDRLDTDNGDNGVYIIEDWAIVGREYHHGAEQTGLPIEDMIEVVLQAQPNSKA